MGHHDVPVLDDFIDTCSFSLMSTKTSFKEPYQDGSPIVQFRKTSAASIAVNKQPYHSPVALALPAAEFHN